MSEKKHSDTAVDTKAEKKESITQSGKGIAFAALIALIFIFVLKYFFFSSSNEGKKNDTSEQSNESISSSNIKGTVTRIDSVSFSGEYGDIHFFPGDFTWTIIESSCSFWILNDVGEEKFGYKNQDISTEFGDTEANQKIRVRGSESGYIKFLVASKK